MTDEDRLVTLPNGSEVQERDVTWPGGICKGGGKAPSMVAQDGKGLCRHCQRWRSLTSQFAPGSYRPIRKHKGVVA